MYSAMGKVHDAQQAKMTASLTASIERAIDQAQQQLAQKRLKEYQNVPWTLSSRRVAALALQFSYRSCSARLCAAIGWPGRCWHVVLITS
jgi:hypothetical protein